MRTGLLLPLAALTLCSGVRSVSRPGNPPALSARVVRYAIEATLDPLEKSIAGTERLTWRNPSSDPVGELQFHMYLNGFRNPVSTFMKESSGRRSSAIRDQHWGGIDLLSIRAGIGPELHDRCTFITPDDDNSRDSTVLRVPLPAPVPPGGEITLTLKFLSRLPRVVARTGYYGDFFMVGQWFPKIGVYEPAGTRFAARGGWNCHQFHASTEFYADFGVYDVDLTVPDRFIVGATGRRSGGKKNGDSTVTYSYHAADVHDFAWTASPLYVESGDTWRHVSIRALVQPQHAGQAARFIRSARAALEYMDAAVGSYPYTDLTIVDPAWGALEAGGMEYPELITVETFSLMPDGGRFPEVVTIHEFAHQYFYGMVATNEFEEAWMDEGFTTYYEARIMDSLFGAKTSAVDLCGFHFGDLEAARMRYTGMLDPGIAPITTFAWKFPPGAYGPLTYDKTALVLSTLEGLIGRAAMDSVMGTYVRLWKFRHPCGRDFVAVVNAVVPAVCGNRFGPDMNWYFDQVLYGTGVCDYELTSITRERVTPAVDDSGAVESVVTAGRRGEVRLPVTVKVRFDDGREVTENWDGESRTVRFRYRGRAGVVWAAVDPERKVTLDVNLINNVRSTAPPEGAIWKYTVKILFWLQNMFLIASAIS
jgi:hypothetical protein